MGIQIKNLFRLNTKGIDTEGMIFFLLDRNENGIRRIVEK